MRAPNVQLSKGLTRSLRLASEFVNRMHHRAEQSDARKRIWRSIDTDGTVGKLSLLELLGADPIIVEVGAHSGRDTQELALAFPHGQVISFEAHPLLFTKLLKRAGQLPNVICVPVALSNHFGLAVFRQSSGASDGSGSLLVPSGHLHHHPNVHFLPEDEIIVTTVTLDAFLKRKGIDRIDLLWMDVQGAEMLVLEGSVKALRHTKWIYSEVSQSPLYQGGATYSEIKSFLSNIGFDVYKEFLPQDWLGEGNVLFVNRSFE